MLAGDGGGGGGGGMWRGVGCGVWGGVWGGKGGWGGGGWGARRGGVVDVVILINFGLSRVLSMPCFVCGPHGVVLRGCSDAKSP